jgi:hypothetical protein
VIKHWKYGYVPRSTAALKITQLMVELKFLGLPVCSPQVFSDPGSPGNHWIDYGGDAQKE